MKKMFKKIAAKMIVLAIISQIFTITALANNTSPFKLEATAIDTIAGLGTVIKSSNTLKNKEVVFAVKKPGGEKIRINAMSDDNGVAIADIPESHTQKAGTYYIWAKLSNGDYHNSNTFKVYADDISIDKSTVKATSLNAKSNGKDKIYLTVTLNDQFNNPIEGHIIHVMSDNENLNVQSLRKENVTNEDGEMIYSVSSNVGGISTVSFLDTTTNSLLKQKIKLSFTVSGKAIGGFIPVALAQSGEVSKLEFENLPDTIQPNSDISFTLTAYDSEDVVVPNYIGEVHFSSEGDNSIYATLPNDYTFDADLDEGSHTFSGINALNFSQPGTYTIIATDLVDRTIRGETTITVGSSSTSSTTTHSASSGSGDLVITTPSPGTYTDDELAIIGIGPADSTIQIFDNDVNIGETDILGDGTFTFDNYVWTEGTHQVFAVALDAVGDTVDTSDTLSFTIDKSAPEVDNITFDPDSGIKTGDVIEVKVYAEPNLSGAIIFNDDIVELTMDISKADLYLATIQAPAETGIYAVDVILVDELGNEGLYEAIAEISVDTEGTTEITVEDGMEGDGDDEEDEDDEIVIPDEDILDDDETIIEEPVTNQPPSDVFGLKAFSSDKKVTLFWQDALDDDGIDHYKIYYGVTPFTLNNVIDTFDDNNTWYIPNLDNGTEYFFAVAAIDTDGLESQSKSSIVSSIPFSSQTAAVEEETQMEESDLKPTSIQKSGPEHIVFFFIALCSGALYFAVSKRLTLKKD